MRRSGSQSDCYMRMIRLTGPHQRQTACRQAQTILNAPSPQSASICPASFARGSRVLVSLRARTSIPPRNMTRTPMRTLSLTMRADATMRQCRHRALPPGLIEHPANHHDPRHFAAARVDHWRALPGHQETAPSARIHCRIPLYKPRSATPPAPRTATIHPTPPTAGNPRSTCDPPLRATHNPWALVPSRGYKPAVRPVHLQAHATQNRQCGWT